VDSVYAVNSEMLQEAGKMSKSLPFRTEVKLYETIVNCFDRRNIYIRLYLI